MHLYAIIMLQKCFRIFLRWTNFTYGSYLIMIRQWRYLVLGRHDSMLAATNMVHALDWIALPGTPVKSWYLLGISWVLGLVIDSTRSATRGFHDSPATRKVGYKRGVYANIFAVDSLYIICL
jgi:hypothetical protein